MVKQSPQWLCCQLGAREHYAIPRSLHSQGRLIGLVTDAWVKPKSLVSRGASSFLRGRFHADLATDTVYHSTPQLIAFELRHKIQKRSGWDTIVARNLWFQQRAIKQLRQLTPLLSTLSPPPVIFAYSYAALGIFSYAKQQNWVTVLGQIDPGPKEEHIVRNLHQAADPSMSQWSPAPETYWKTWHQECDLADAIVVNSAWSNQALIETGVERNKIKIVPLAYDPPPEANSFNRTYPLAFIPDRPLRVLFLGQVNLRKGILPLLQAVDTLASQPLELWVVGPIQADIPQKWLSHPQIKWIGTVPRIAVTDYYRQVDVFILPTYSDGFAITQLEACAWQLPLIVSANCGQVAINGISGIVLPDLEPNSIARALLTCLTNPAMLASMVKQISKTYSYSLDQLCERLDLCLL